jgi:hypothetical protein
MRIVIVIGILLLLLLLLVLLKRVYHEGIYIDWILSGLVRFWVELLLLVRLSSI